MTQPDPHAPPNAPRHPALVALVLSLGAAVALGITRFAYGLLLPAMREDLGWSYFLAGAMNTANAVGYLIGALLTPALMRRLGAWRVLMGGTVLASVFMAVSGWVTDAGALMAQRVLAGAASAWVFVAGGVLAARLGAQFPRRAGWLIGLYYGGTGIGIALSAVLVPAAMAAAQAHGAPHAWQWPWLALGAACLAAAAIIGGPSPWRAAVRAPFGAAGRALMSGRAQAIGNPAAASEARRGFVRRDFGFGLGGYFLFGAGYIGYMTFIVALLRQQGMSDGQATGFYAALGVAVLASARIWARMLDRFRGGESLAILCTVLAVVTVLPALSGAVPLVFLSGLVFGATFLSVVAATTALVRHNLPQDAWPDGIAAFTTVFALGQIAGPSVVGWVADGPGGLQRGLLVSAGLLLAGAALAWRQKALAPWSGN